MTRLTRNWDLVVTSSALAVIVVGVAAPHVKRLVSMRSPEPTPDLRPSSHVLLTNRS